MLGKKALQAGVDVAQDVLAGENLKTATKKRAKQALDLPSQDSPQSGAHTYMMGVLWQLFYTGPGLPLPRPGPV